MYAWPVLLPAQSNREDFFKTIGLFDDDTGDALDVSGRTLAGSGDFTGSNWTVTDGTINTASTSTLTIKDYPFGNEMQAIALDVAPDLGILPGDLITIADPTGLNTMTGYVTSYAIATGAMVCQIGSNFDLEIRGHDDRFDGYGPSEFIGGSTGPIIRAQLGRGILVVGVGAIQVRVPAFVVFKLRHKTYDIDMIVFDGHDTRQLFIGSQPILWGGVSTMPFALPQPPNPFGLP
jgi:hypothetical protein